MIPQVMSSNAHPAPPGPPVTSAIHPTSERQLDEAVGRLREAAPAFVRLPLTDRIALARSMQAGYLRIAEQSVRAGCAAKGIPLGTPAEGEEWATGPWCVVRHLRLVAESLTSLQRLGNTPIGQIRRTADGRLAVRVFPANTIDGVLFAGITVEVRMQAGIDETELHGSRAAFYRGRSHDGRTVLVLGAGNLAAIPAMDVITKMFNEGKTCLLKMNPVNAYLGPFLEDAFGDAIRRNLLAVVYGGADEGAYLAQHTGIDEIHLTGSDRTYDHIVWGPPGPERDARKARNTPLLSKPVTAELGSVSPILVVPGPYKEKELAFQAESIAGAVANNASFNCNAPKMLVTPQGWAGRDRLLTAIERALAAAPVRRAYYPGAEERWQQLTRGRTSLRAVGTARAGELPVDADPGSRRDGPARAGVHDRAVLLDSVGDRGRQRGSGRVPRAGRGLCQQPALGHAGRGSRRASCVPQGPTRCRGGRARDCAAPLWCGDGEQLERLHLRVRYAAVGRVPGSRPSDIQSGTGWVHNTPMLEGIEKAVLRHPLTIVPKPVTFPRHRTADIVLRRLTQLDERASWTRVPGVVVAAMRG